MMIKNVWIRRSLIFIMLVGLLLISLFTFFGFLGYFGWLFDLTSNFRLQYAVASVILSLLFLLLKKWRYAFISIILLFINAYELLPYIFLEKHEQTNCVIKVSAINLLSSNREFDKVLQYLAAEDPDIIIFQEYTQWWEDSFKDTLNNYSYRYEVNRTDNFGISIFSKNEPKDIKILDLTRDPIPSLLATFNIKEREVKLLGTHPLPPASGYQFDLRNEQLQKIASLKKELGNHFVIAGDLNTTPYSYYFKLFKRRLQLNEARFRNGINSSWPTFAWIFAIPIDHILVSSTIDVKKFTSGTDIGSDHLPVTACLSFSE